MQIFIIRRIKIKFEVEFFFALLLFMYAFLHEREQSPLNPVTDPMKKNRVLLILSRILRRRTVSF